MTDLVQAVARIERYVGGVQDLWTLYLGPAMRTPFTHPDTAFADDLRLILAEVKRLTEAADALSSREGGEGPSREEALRWFLRMLEACGGQADASDNNWSPLNVFCEDFQPLDTFNLAIEAGYTRSTHDSSFDTSTVYLTDLGRSALSQDAILALSREGGEGVQHEPEVNHAKPFLCEDCPPVGYPTDETRCSPCPRSSPAKPLSTEAEEH